MKERLTVRTARGLKLKNGRKRVELLSDKELTKTALERLAEYEDVEEQGLLVRLLCKVGDTCYFVTKVAEEYELLCGVVISICIDNGGIWFSCHYSVGMSYWHNSKDKDLFFTLPEAEKKLEELKEKKDD